MPPFFSVHSEITFLFQDPDKMASPLGTSLLPSGRPSSLMPHGLASVNTQTIWAQRLINLAIYLLVWVWMSYLFKAHITQMQKVLTAIPLLEVQGKLNNTKLVVGFFFFFLIFPIEDHTILGSGAVSCDLMHSNPLHSLVFIPFFLLLCSPAFIGHLHSGENLGITSRRGRAKIWAKL